MAYKEFLDSLDKRLEKYFELHKEHINCCLGCSSCCETVDYPISQIELEYLMQGFEHLSNKEKATVQNRIKNIAKSETCPFLIDKKCSVYPYRPLVCRVHGLAYICHDEVVKVPYCASKGKNYSEVYKDGEIEINPIKENLDTKNLLKDFDFGEIRKFIDWIKK